MSPDERVPGGDERPLRFEEVADREFQRRWQEARQLSGDQVDQAFAHGLAARERFAERPFREVEDYLRESWEALGSPAPWNEVYDIVESGYDRARAAPLEVAADLPPEALERFADRTTGGSTLGGQLGQRSFLGGSEPVSDYEGEGGPPVEKGRRVRE
jgi:hypothetical protein